MLCQLFLQNRDDDYILPFGLLNDNENIDLWVRGVYVSSRYETHRGDMCQRGCVEIDYRLLNEIRYRNKACSVPRSVAVFVFDR